MRFQVIEDKLWIPVPGALPLLAVALLLGGVAGCGDHVASAAAPAPASTQNDTVQLTATQLRNVSVQVAAEHTFTVEREAIGTIDFDQDRAVAVSPPYQGRILRLFAEAGDKVRKGQLLFTIDSADLVQAESTLISAAGVLKLDTAALTRAQRLYAIKGIAEKDYQQTISDQQAAVASYRGARDAVRIFGKSDAEIDAIETQRRVDASMPVVSPISGVVTARDAAPGALVQPGGTPVPYAVADVTTKWLLAQVPETDLPALSLHQEVDARVPAYPGRVFHGRIDYIAEAVDPNTHRGVVRSQLSDPHDELRAQMFATFTVHVGAPRSVLAVPAEAVVREGDGTMSVWVTTDGTRFTHRTVEIGDEQGGLVPVLKGLSAGERYAASNALFVSNAAVVGAAE